MIKEILIKALSFWGYKLSKESNFASFSNFKNLAKGYEQMLNESGNILETNEIRIKLLARLIGTRPAEAYFIIQSLYRSKDVYGSVCEFGVAQGETSALIANEILSSNKILHLFDSFEGLPKPSEKDQLKDDIKSFGTMEAYTGDMRSPEKMVRSRLNAIAFPSDRFFIHKGFIEELLKKDSNLPSKVSFAYVDFDFYEPIRVTLDFLHQTTLPGSIIIVDDYDYFSTGAKTAVDEFLKEKNSSKMVYDSLVPNSQYGHFIVLTRTI